MALAAALVASDVGSVLAFALAVLAIIAFAFATLSAPFIPFAFALVIRLGGRSRFRFRLGVGRDARLGLKADDVDNLRV